MMSNGDFESELFDLYGEAQAGSSDSVTQRTIARVRARARVDAALRIAAGVACAAAVAVAGVAVWPAVRRAVEGDLASVLPLALLGIGAACLGAVRLSRGL